MLLQEHVRRLECETLRGCGAERAGRAVPGRARPAKLLPHFHYGHTPATQTGLEKSIDEILMKDSRREPSVAIVTMCPLDGYLRHDAGEAVWPLCYRDYSFSLVPSGEASSHVSSSD